MVDSRIGALDALRSAISNLKGVSDALCARASLEDDNLASMLSESLDVQAGRLSDVEKWLEGRPARQPGAAPGAAASAAASGGYGVDGGSGGGGGACWITYGDETRYYNSRDEM